MAEFQSKFTGQEIENTIDKLRNWLAAGIDGTYPTVTISSVTYDVIWKVIPTPGAKCYGIGLDRSTGRPYEIYYDGSSYKATALDTNTDTKNTAGAIDNNTDKLYLVGAKNQGESAQTYSNSKVYTQNGKLYSNNTEVSVVGHTHDSKYVKKSGDTITGKLTVQSGDASGCLQIGADVASNTLTAGTRKLARMTFPTREYGTTKTCSIMSCDNNNNYNYVEFGGHIGDATNTAPDYMCFNVDKTHNSLSPATKECVMAISPSSLKLFRAALDAGQITSFDSISSKWVFNNANTFKNSSFTYTLPNKTGTLAIADDIPKALKNPNALTFGSKTYDGSSAQTITLADLGGQAAGNYAILGSNGKLDDSVIPAVAITDTYVVDTETAMLALNAQKGDIAIRSDLNKSFVLQSTPASTLAN